MELHNVTTTTAISNSSSSGPEPPGEEFGKESFDQHHPRFSEDFDSNCSTPYVSAPSSPGRAHGGYFFSAPTSPMHFMLSSSSNVSKSSCPTSLDHSGGSFEFDFSARFSSSSSSAGAAGSMISADELFLNGQIRPMKLSSHLQRPQVLAPLLDLEEEDPEADTKDSFRGRDLRLRNRSLHRRARSLSPLRNSPWHQSGSSDHPAEEESWESNDNDIEIDVKTALPESSTETTPASSRSSSSGSRSSKRWEFLKDFLRSKSEGRGNTKEKFWNSLSFSPIKDKRTTSSSSSPSLSISKEKKHHLQPTHIMPQMKSKPNQSVSGKSKPANGVSKRRVPQSAHEIHYTTKRAQAEEMKKKTFLPYRQGLLGCLGFSSKGYGAMNGFARSLNPVSSR